MFFRGIHSSAWLRAAYLLTIVCLATLPLPFFGLHQSSRRMLAYFSVCVLLFDLLVAVLHRPRDVRVAFYGFLACLLHVIQLGD